jgi:hypothetical protein
LTLLLPLLLLLLLLLFLLLLPVRLALRGPCLCEGETATAHWAGKPWASNG